MTETVSSAISAHHALNHNEPYADARDTSNRIYEDWPAEVIGGRTKRVFDATVATILLVFLSPLLVIVALGVWLHDRGSPFFLHTRVGLGGRPFNCIKFRSMVKNGDVRLAELLATCPAARSEWARTRKLTKDPRITSLGKFLRKSSIDELPQLINVIRGDMSLVGPRPVVAEELARYDLDRVHYLRTRPGVTGLWQVSGRSTTTFKKRVALDKTYTLRWSFLRDIGILARTLPAVLFGHGAV